MPKRTKNHEKKQNDILRRYHKNNSSNQYQRFSGNAQDTNMFQWNRTFKHFSYFPNYPSNMRYQNNRKRTPETTQKYPATERPTSPFSGSEEYILKKIQKTSDMIKKRLSMPESYVLSERNAVVEEPPKDSEKTMEKNSKSDVEKVVPSKVNKKPTQYNVEEIHQKIISHITKLNYGKKVNLICSNSSGYDAAIQQIQKQKRLELSKALRDMCSNQNAENSEVIDAIIPDIGIKIGELPLDVIKALSSTLDIDFNEDLNVGETNFDYNGKLFIKEEMLDITENPIIPEIIQTQEKIVNSVNCQTENLDPFDVNDVNDLESAINLMTKIDEEIDRLTKLRQSIFKGLYEKQNVNKTPESTVNSVKYDPVPGPNPQEITPIQNDDFEVLIKERDVYYDNVLNLENIPEKILVIKLIEDTLVAASDVGNLFFINTIDGATKCKIEVTNAAITSLCYWITVKKRQMHILLGAKDNMIHEYNYETRQPVRLTSMHGPVQCMDLAWNCVFVGTTNGRLVRYCLKTWKIEFQEVICEGSVMVLKATQEGARRVLLVGLRDAPVCVRDAISGLHLRTLAGFVTPTVYCLLIERSLVYCGTMQHGILVHRFNDGNFLCKHEALNSKGISCMKIVDNLLFASCYNGQIYVYNVKTQKFVGTIEGPGSVILSMEIVKNIIIIGTMTPLFKSILIPDYILENNKI